MLKIISSLLLKIWGWKIKGKPAKDKKLMLVVMPHTSNWDFLMGLLTRWKLGLKIKFVGKSSLFKFPYGFIFRFLGGYPVERDPKKKKGSVSEQITSIIKQEDNIWITFTPEGTRKKVKKLKTGFYTIAKAAGIRIQYVAFDFTTKTIIFNEPHFPAETFEDEYKLLKVFYSPYVGKNAEKTYVF
ncbi:MAG TPA: acyltransferase [Bacteroidetes bacterium]|nr:acyltransferase [Bacteroidota bacterium]